MPTLSDKEDGTGYQAPSDSRSGYLSEGTAQLVTWNGTSVYLVEGDISRLGIEVIVCPANTFLVMRGGVSAVLRVRADHGDKLELDAVNQGPIRIGDAVLTRAYDLPAQRVIHAPTVEMPVDRASTESVRQAIRAALRVARRHGFREIGFPSMGTGTGGITYDEAADVMLREIRGETASGNATLTRVILVAWEVAFGAAVRAAILRVASGPDRPGLQTPDGVRSREGSYAGVWLTE